MHFTRFARGWTLHIGNDPNPRSLRNFLMQGNGAELMRLACCLATERGIPVCLPIHDALLVEGSMDCMDKVVKETKAAMAEASRVVLGGFALRTDTKIVRWPERFMDKRGIKMWNIVMKILEEAEK